MAEISQCKCARLSVERAKYFPVNTVKKFLRVEVQFHSFLASESDSREVKSQLHAMIALYRINGLLHTLSGQLDRSKSRNGGFGKK